MNSIFLRALLCLGILGALAAVPSQAADRKVRVTATTSMVADMARRVGGDRVEVQALMGPGIDPHLYKPTAADGLKLQRADVILYNGLLLEGKMQDLFTQMARRKKHVYAITEGLPSDKLLNPPGLSGHHDPHVWFDIPLWAATADVIAEALAGFDPLNASVYRRNAAATKQDLSKLHEWARQRVSELPKAKRILITSHDAFNYFGRAYDFQVVALQGISTVTEAGLSDMAQLVDFVKKHKVRAVFVESSVPHATIQRISTDAGVKIGGELFSDAMGTPGEMENGYDLGTYEGMIRHNVNTIVDSLKQP